MRPWPGSLAPVLLAAASGCARLTMAGTPPPATLAEYDSLCWIEGHTLVPPTPKELHDDPRSKPEIVASEPGNAVADGHARFAESWLRTEYVWQAFAIELHPPFEIGAVREVGGQSYWEWGTLGVHGPLHMAGSVRIVSMTIKRIELAVDLVFTDRRRRAEHFTEVIELRRVPDLKACLSK